MNQETWTSIDQYFTDLLVPQDPVLKATLELNAKKDLPPHDVSPTQGKFLHLLARAQGARRILEIGTLGAYSTIWLACALPKDGQVITLESNPNHADVARVNIKRAGLEHMVDIRVGPALDSLPKLSAEHQMRFDLIFIDADKPNNPAYLEWALKLSRPGTLIIGDNVVRNGAVADPSSNDLNVKGVRRFTELLSTQQPSKLSEARGMTVLF